MIHNKNNVRSLFLVVVYCVSVMMAGTGFTFINHKEKGSRDNTISKVSLVVSSQSLPTSGFSQLKPVFTAPFLNVLFHFTRVSNRVFEKKGAAFFRQYFLYNLSNNFRLDVSEIIFPFHYFW